MIVIIFVLYFPCRNAVDVPNARIGAPNMSNATVAEESTEYKGNANPYVQSRSFKILQASLSYSEAPG